jgi:hypothetical protein
LTNPAAQQKTAYVPTSCAIQLESIMPVPLGDEPSIEGIARTEQPSQASTKANPELSRESNTH